jgi:hypothetical protein
MRNRSFRNAKHSFRFRRFSASSRPETKRRVAICLLTASQITSRFVNAPKGQTARFRQPRSSSDRNRLGSRGLKKVAQKSSYAHEMIATQTCARARFSAKTP